MSYSFRIEQAIRAAAVLHKDQVRKGRAPYPYVTHVYAVAMIVSDYTDEEDAVVTALLHDTIEDTDYTEDELRSDFGDTVTKMVLALSEPQPGEGERISWKDKKSKYVKQLKSAPENALIVVAADKIHNMRAIVEEFYDRPSEFKAAFHGSLDDRLLMYQEISNVLNRRLTNDIIHEFNHVYKEYKNFIQNAQKETERF